MRIYVGNLSYEMTDDDLRGMFEPYGEVSSANVITDKFTGSSKGFGFVEMPAREAGQKAISELRGREVRGRALNVDEAKPQGMAGGGGGGGGRPGGGGGRPGGGGGRGPRGGGFGGPRGGY
ncbi:MAG: RNA-binding protein [Acidobacteria bacterium]|nr:RNA-binding protein [Acidobacteriota bacterium]